MTSRSLLPRSARFAGAAGGVLVSFGRQHCNGRGRRGCVAGVDAATEQAIINVLKGLRDAGKTVVAVHHDLSTVRDYFDDVFLINTQAVAEGPVETTFTQENLQTAYGGRLAGAQMDALGDTLVEVAAR